MMPKFLKVTHARTNMEMRISTETIRSIFQAPGQSVNIEIHNGTVLPVLESLDYIDRQLGLEQAPPSNDVVSSVLELLKNAQFFTAYLPHAKHPTWCVEGQNLYTHELTHAEMVELITRLSK